MSVRFKQLRKKMTPNIFTVEALKKLPNFENMTMFTFSKWGRFRFFLENGYIYSKGTLWGLGHGDIANRRMSTVKDSQLGFIDYIYLDARNHMSHGFRNFYGDYGFEIKIASILPSREHFAFPFNTGHDWDAASERFKRSDITTLEGILSKGYGEVLVRRSIRLNRENIVKVHTNGSERGKSWLRAKIDKNEYLQGVDVVYHEIEDRATNLESITVHGEIYTKEFFQVKDNVIGLLREDSDHFCYYHLNTDNSIVVPGTDEVVGSAKLRLSVLSK